MPLRIGLRAIVLGAIGVTMALSPAFARTLKVGGTGAATELLRQLAPGFKADSGINLEVIPGLGTSGALGALMLAVTDTGTGMPAEVLAKVFDPFFTTKEAGKGTGLGLSMVYGFIKQSNGHIEVQSAPGRGTTFRLYLPRTAEALEEPAPQAKPSAPRGAERILVVEDEPGVRTIAVEQLRSLGYHVDDAVDGTAGLAAFEAASQAYDLLLTDVVMPRMDGKALADAVASRWPPTRIVFMSGYAESAIVHEGTIDAGVLLLSKPFRKRELAQLIRQALDAPAKKEAL